ncbi:MAG: hypothetical protein ACPGWR_16510, partial [Ardenticatenaceae bacterium]
VFYPGLPEQARMRVLPRATGTSKNACSTQGYRNKQERVFYPGLPEQARMRVLPRAASTSRMRVLPSMNKQDACSTQGYRNKVALNLLFVLMKAFEKRDLGKRGKG